MTSDAMTTDPGEIRKLSRKIHSLLNKSHGWVAWSDALEGALSLERLSGVEVKLCVDTSEVVEFLSPSYLKQKKPTPDDRDYSVSLLFQRYPQLFLLPAHYSELEGVTSNWIHHLDGAITKLKLLKETMNAVRQRWDSATPEEQSAQLVEAVLKEPGAIFGSWFGPVDGYEGRYRDLKERLEILTSQTLGLDDWEYLYDSDRVMKLYEQLKEMGVSRNGPRADLIDAHALHFLERINSELGNKHLVLLLSRSGKIWQSLDRYRYSSAGDEADADLLCEWVDTPSGRTKISIVQPPQLVLVQEMLRTSKTDRVEELMQMAKDLGRADGIKDLRFRVKHQCLPLLQKGEVPDDVHQLIDSLHGEITQLRNKYSTWINLEHFKHAVELLDDESVGDLGRFRRAVRDVDKEALSQLLDEKLKPVIDSMETLQRRISVSFAPLPDISLSFESTLGMSSLGTRAILRSHPGGGVVYAPEFQSEKVRRWIEKLQPLLKLLNSEAEETRATAREALLRDLFECEVELKGHPEFYLLLNSIYSSHDKWFQAYEAAVQGRRSIWKSEMPRAKTRRPQEHLASTCELLLAEATALRVWTLELYWDLPLVAAGLLEKAAQLCRLCRQRQRDWEKSLSPRSTARREARCLRELSILYGAAREIDLRIEPGAQDLQEANLSAKESKDPSLGLFRFFARRAVEALKEEELEMRMYYVNGLLYALTVSGNECELEERRALAREFDKNEQRRDSDPILLDTQAWHHYHLARHQEKAGEAFQEELEQARRMISRAVDLSSDREGYYGELVRRHRAEIFAAEPFSPT
ncbi:MAG: hypothetical protein K0U98_07915 [Deltaproteobacteria bacterium]|nr:hypothetical protein [Deltaproteobacteria bacterium]